jgi:hypothetical protein
VSKPHNDRLAVVTATVDLDGSATCRQSWETRAAYQIPTYVVQGVWGVVPAFAQGVAEAFGNGAEAVVCLHSDVRIDQRDWDCMVQDQLDAGVQFAGFGGGSQLGGADLYQTPYDPMQLARGGFVSNMEQAEAHGRRSRVPVRCVVFDGFCQIGTKDWFRAAWAKLGASGIVHHFYDGALGCLAARAGVQPGVMIPVACHHFGGREAVGSQEYHQWAKTQHPDGDQGFWQQAHQWAYEEFRDVLPLAVGR